MLEANLSSLEITAMLRAWSAGGGEEAEKLFPLVYDELHRQAHNFLRRERPGHTLQTGALINETYIKLSRHPDFEWESRKHFFATCATLMRHILIDHAKTRTRVKRGARTLHIPIDELRLATEQVDVIEILSLDKALERLYELDARQARIAELRFFSGFNVTDTAEVLGISPTTVKREWRMARAWLGVELKREIVP